jgi:hypothetical protein
MNGKIIDNRRYEMFIKKCIPKMKINMEPNTYFASELDTKSEKPKSICPSSNTVN